MLYNKFHRKNIKNQYLLNKTIIKFQKAKEELNIEDLKLKQEQRMMVNSIIPINVKEKDFELLMNIYNQALEQVYNQLKDVKEKTSRLYDYDIINNITKRIKKPESIINKMKKKGYEINYKNLTENINDIAGIRVICPVKNNVYTMIDIINELPNIRVLKVKDYITKAKKSGYSGYHMIVETPIEIEEREVYIKVEIQLRTMAMDFWSTNEHKIKYKSNNKLSSIDSKKLTHYAKIVNILDDKMAKIYQKQINKKQEDIHFVNIITWNL